MIALNKFASAVILAAVYSTISGNEYIEEEIVDEFGNKTIIKKKVDKCRDRWK